MQDLKNKLLIYGDVQENVSLKTMTTLRIGGVARFVVFPKSVIALMQVVEEIKKAELPIKIIGKGSNLLCSDQYFDGVILRLDHTFCDYYFDGNQCCAEAGCSIISLAYAAMKEGLSGLEFASGIPGTVGGVTFMNAGAYKSSMKDIIEEVLVYRNHECVWLSKEECHFTYRHSIFHDNEDWIILAVRLHLSNSAQSEIRELIESRRERRMKSQPLNFPSAGSVFRNFPDRAAWQCIEELGFRGKSIGGAEVSDKHANFIINKNDASASDFLELINEIKVASHEKYGQSLIMEVEMFNWNE